MALASVARLAMLPMQDVLALGGADRMNQPGIAEGNWRWRFGWNKRSCTPQRTTAICCNSTDGRKVRIETDLKGCTDLAQAGDSQQPCAS